jgi:plastocyanin
MILTRMVALAALFMAVLFAAGCSGDDEEEEVTATPVPPPAASPTGVLTQPEPVQPLDAEFTEATDGVIEITIQGAVFVGNKLRVGVGETVTLDVTNRDGQPHNLRLAGFDGEFQTEDDALTDPDPIAANGSGSLEFAPAVLGAYTFRCDYHPGSMGGQVVVE